MVSKLTDRDIDGKHKANCLFSNQFAGSEADELMMTFRSLNSDPARCAFADRMVRHCTDHLDRLWPNLYQALHMVREYRIYERPRAKTADPDDAVIFTSFEDYFEKVVGKPFEHWAELEATYQFVHQCKPELLKASYADAAKAREKADAELLKVIASEDGVPPLSSNGGGGLGRGGRPIVIEYVPPVEVLIEKAKEMASEPVTVQTDVISLDCDNNESDDSEAKSYGTSREYKIARIKREAENPDSPNQERAKDVLAKLQSGEIKSAAGAERAVRGEDLHPERKRTTKLDRAKNAYLSYRAKYAKLNEAEREAFRQWLQEIAD